MTAVTCRSSLAIDLVALLLPADLPTGSSLRAAEEAILNPQWASSGVPRSDRLRADEAAETQRSARSEQVAADVHPIAEERALPTEPAQSLESAALCIGFRGERLAGRQVGEARHPFPRGGSRPKFRKAAVCSPRGFSRTCRSISRRMPEIRTAIKWEGLSPRRGLAGVVERALWSGRPGKGMTPRFDARDILSGFGVDESSRACPSRLGVDLARGKWTSGRRLVGRPVGDTRDIVLTALRACRLILRAPGVRVSLGRSW